MSTVYVTRTPDNLLSYQIGFVTESLKTRYRVTLENNIKLTFINTKNENFGWYVFKFTPDLKSRIEKYQNKENDLIELIKNSEKVQNILADVLSENLSINGSSFVDLNNPEVEGSNFYINTKH
jgi:hypothetical protein